MYFVPIFVSFILIGVTIYWPWIYKQYKKGKTSSERQLNEHRENMAELTSLIETVLNFELDQSTVNVRTVAARRAKSRGGNTLNLGENINFFENGRIWKCFKFQLAEYI
jgi:hypothetical protein